MATTKPQALAAPAAADFVGRAPAGGDAGRVLRLLPSPAFSLWMHAASLQVVPTPKDLRTEEAPAWELVPLLSTQSHEGGLAGIAQMASKTGEVNLTKHVAVRARTGWIPAPPNVEVTAFGAKEQGYVRVFDVPQGKLYLDAWTRPYQHAGGISFRHDRVGYHLFLRSCMTALRSYIEPEDLEALASGLERLATLARGGSRMHLDRNRIDDLDARVQFLASNPLSSPSKAA